MNNRYGHYSELGDSFKVTRFDTPLPWVNYLTNGDYCAIVSSTGGGFSFYKSHHANMVLRREQRNIINDRPGRYVYIRDNQTGEFWTINVMPIKKPHEAFCTTHGMGYTQIESKTDGIKGSIKFFVPSGFDAEIAKIQIKNESVSKRDLSVFFYEEVQVGNYYFNEHERNIATMFQVSSEKDKTLFYNYKLWTNSKEPGDNFKATQSWPYTVFVTTTQEAQSFETSQERFIGCHRDVHDPMAVINNELSSQDNDGRFAVAAFKWEVSLEANASFETDVITGISLTADVESKVDQIKKPNAIKMLYDKTIAYWAQFVSNIKINTPDEDINRHFNYWNKYQLFVNFSFGRAPSYYHLEQSMGMRDSFQDAFGMIPLNPNKAREQILRVASFIFSDGSPCDVTSRIEYKANKGIKVDVPLWMALATANYIKETADWAVLDEVLPYLDGGSGSLYEHIQKGILRVAKEPGMHGLPLFGGGDWNDSLNRVGEKGKGESVWLAQFIYFCIQEIKPILAFKGDHDKIVYFDGIASELKKAHENHCWDGNWYIIGFNDDHQALGTKDDRVGQIYLNTQTWAVISGIGDTERLQMAMDAVDKHLETQYGLSLVRTAYDRLDEKIGVSSAFAPGMKENGAVFSHATAFNLVGKAMLGRGDDLYRVYKSVLPSTKDSDVYKVEPYIYSQFAAGPDSPDFGRGGYHWMTGTSAWMIRVVSDYMLGALPDYEGLVIDPCIPSHWDAFEMQRVFRGSTYQIQVKNPKHIQKGVHTITVDGAPIEGNTLPVFGDGKTHEVQVVMG